MTELTKFEQIIMDCEAFFTVSTRYADGGIDFDHGMPERSLPCSCFWGRHYQAPNGELFPSLWERTPVEEDEREVKK